MFERMGKKKEMKNESDIERGEGRLEFQRDEQRKSYCEKGKREV